MKNLSEEFEKDKEQKVKDMDIIILLMRLNYYAKAETKIIFNVYEESEDVDREELLGEIGNYIEEIEHEIIDRVRK